MFPFIHVPQKPYIAQKSYTPQNSIFFSAQGCLGFHLRSACDGKMTLLDGSDERPMVETNSRVTLCILVSCNYNLVHNVADAILVAWLSYVALYQHVSQRPFRQLQ